MEWALRVEVVAAPLAFEERFPLLQEVGYQIERLVFEEPLAVDGLAACFLLGPYQEFGEGASILLVQDLV